MEPWISQHQLSHQFQIVAAYRESELTDLFQCLDMSFDFGPAWEPIQTRDLE
jgi:hypothetical protein